MKMRLPQLVTLLASAFFLSDTNGRGQGAAPGPPASDLVDATKAGPAASKPDRVRFDDAIEKKRVEASFDNLPLTEVVVWLEKSFPEVNFVLPQRLMELNPTVFLRMRAAGLRDVLEAINIATDGVVLSEVRSPTLVALRLRVEPAPSAPVPFGQPPLPIGVAPQMPPPELAVASGVPTAPPPPEMLPPTGVAAVAPMPDPGQGLGVDDGRARPGVASETSLPTYRVINLRENLHMSDPKKIADLLEATRQITDQALKIMAGDSPETHRIQPLKSFAYHEGSGVLVIIGQPEAIGLAMEVILNVRGQGAGDAGASPGAENSGGPK